MTLSERIRARPNDAPLPTEFLLDDAADAIDALVAALGEARVIVVGSIGSANANVEKIDAALALARGT